jgi:peptide/nickel transport system ATP-binding protein
MSSDQDKALLEITDLCIDGFSNNRWHQIVRHVNLRIDRGGILGLIGESGAGKSTIGIAAMGYAKPGCRITQGSIKFENFELTTATEEEKRILRGSRIAYVAQSAAASFNPAHKLIDQFSECVVQHGIGSREQAYADAKELYNRIKMPDPNRIGFRYPHQVSGGQLQRAMTAMALSCRPNLIIFDEPTTALDVTTQIEVLSTIRDIVQQFNTAAIYISHDLAVVAQMADKILVLRDGEPIEEAETRTMISRPKQEYTKSLWAVRSFQKSTTPLNFKSTPHIKIEQVTAAYAKSTDNVLVDVNFEIMQGETVAIVGESGSGKSTMARVITGLLPPKHGMVFFEGAQLPNDYRDRTAQQLQKIQMIYQMPDTAINPRQKIRQIVGRQLSLHLDLEGDAKQRRLEDLMDMVDMEPKKYLDRYPEELSGGQKQRVCIARALAADPSFVICDEVTSALDQIIAEGILRLLDRLQQELKLAYMFITHDLATVKAIADRVVVMQQGYIVDQGLKSEVFEPPYHEYTELLLSSVPEMDPDWMDRVIADRLRKNRMQSSGI